MTPNWKLTAATLNCDDTKDEVTIIVYKDWSVKCTGMAKQGKSEKPFRRPGCTGIECKLITQYKNKLMAEEPK